MVQMKWSHSHVQIWKKIDLGRRKQHTLWHLWKPSGPYVYYPIYHRVSYKPFLPPPSPHGRAVPSHQSTALPKGYGNPAWCCMYSGKLSCHLSPGVPPRTCCRWCTSTHVLSLTQPCSRAPPGLGRWEGSCGGSCESLTDQWLDPDCDWCQGTCVTHVGYGCLPLYCIPVQRPSCPAWHTVCILNLYQLYVSLICKTKMLSHPWQDYKD